MGTVYAMKDSRKTGIISVFYVGFTTDLYRRFCEHMRCNDGNGRKFRIIQEITEANLQPLMEPLEETPYGPNNTHSQEREAYWIHHFLELGAPLTNVFIPPLPTREYRGEDYWLWSEEEQCWKINKESNGRTINEQIATPYDLPPTRIGNRCKVRSGMYQRPLFTPAHFNGSTPISAYMHAKKLTTY